MFWSNCQSTSFPRDPFEEISEKKNKASACRELRQEIKSLSFITNDQESLESLEEGLLDLRDMLLASCPIDSTELVIEEPEAQKRFEKIEASNIPVPQKKAINHSRVGIKADKKRKAQSLEKQILC